jgi:AraC-like DNA-binding protein
MNKFELKIENRLLTSVFLKKNFELLHNSQLNMTPSQVIEAFPKTWFVFFQKPGNFASIGLKTPNHTHFLCSNVAIFLPPYALVRWQISKGLNEWWAYRIASPLPPELNLNILKIPWDTNWIFNNSDDLLKKILILKDNSERLQSEWSNSGIARQIKFQIDSYFQEGLPLSELAKYSDSSLSSASHCFKKCYGITPIKYCNQLRMHEAILQMSFESQSVTNACYNSGFNDFSRFFRNMKNYFDASPSKFSRRAIKD